MAPDLPLVSVITPSYNNGHYIEETIQSVLSQDYPRIEYIVIDGASTDNTLEILQKYEGRLRWMSEPDRGQTDALNKGIRLAQGEIIGSVGADDLYRPGSVSRAVNAFLSDPYRVMVYGGCDFISAYGKLLSTKPGLPFTWERLLGQNHIAHATVFLRRVVVERVGAYNPEFPHYVPDWEYWVRIALAFDPEQILGLSEVQAAYRIHSQGKSMSAALHEVPLIFQVLDRTFSDPRLPLHVRKARRRIYARMHLTSAEKYYSTGYLRRARSELARALVTYPLTFHPDWLYWPRFWVKCWIGKERVQALRNLWLPNEVTNA